MSSTSGDKIHFGPFEVTNQVFLTTPHSFAVVNLKPLLPGHVLVCPRKPHLRLTDMSTPELADLFSSVQRVQRMLARRFFPSSSIADGGSFNIALQDGPDAGQTVAHVHVHVIPRPRESQDSAEPGQPDVLYARMAAEDGNVGGALWDAAKAGVCAGSESEGKDRRPVPGGGFAPIEDKDRIARTSADMEAEAELYKTLLAELD